MGVGPHDFIDSFLGMNQHVETCDDTQGCHGIHLAQSFHVVSNIVFIFFAAGSRPEHQLFDHFFVELTLESVAAVNESKGKVASSWSSAYDNRQPPKRQPRKRTFKQMARQVDILKKKKAKQNLPKEAPAVGKKKKNTVAKLPKTKLHVAGHAELENIPANYTRSAKGERMIRQMMEKMLTLDKTAHPSRPMFDAVTGACRSRYLDLGKLWKMFHNLLLNHFDCCRYL